MKKYTRPRVFSETCFETTALACAKNPTPTAGSHHFFSEYDTFTGHLGPSMGASSSISPGMAGVGFGPGGTSQSYPIDGLRANWVQVLS